MSSFYSPDELNEIGIKNIGKNVLISKKASIYGAENISIGNNVRIDDFCILSGCIDIGNYVHISAYNALYGKGHIKIGNFCGISPRSTLFSASDDFSGEFMISPLVDDIDTNLIIAPIILEDFVQIGANNTILPGVTCKQGSVTGACSLILKDLEPWSIYKGIPAVFHKTRSKNITLLAKKYGN